RRLLSCGPRLLNGARAPVTLGRKAATLWSYSNHSSRATPGVNRAASARASATVQVTTSTSQAGSGADDAGACAGGSGLGSPPAGQGTGSGRAACDRASIAALAVAKYSGCGLRGS